MSIRSIVVIAALAVAAALAVPTAASAFSIKEVTFDVEVEGVQTVKWSMHDPIDFECDVAMDGDGTEVWRFETAKPIRMRLSKVDQGRAMFLYENTSFLTKGFPLRSKVTRQGTLDVRGEKICSDGEGTGSTQPPPPDCGTIRTNDVRVGLAYDQDRRSLLKLERKSNAIGTYFENCPEGGRSAPELLTYKGADENIGAQIGRSVPARDLLNPAWEKHIIIAGGTYRQTKAGDESTTTVRWEVTLKRVKNTKYRS